MYKLSSKKVCNKLVNYIYYIISILQNNHNIIKLSVKNSILNEYKKLTGLNELKFIAASPVTMHLENIQKGDRNNILNNYSVTLKADGERYFMFITKSGDVYLLNKSFNILYTGINCKEWAGSLLECEYIDNLKEIYIYDMLFAKGKDIRLTHLKKLFLQLKILED